MVKWVKQFSKELQMAKKHLKKKAQPSLLSRQLQIKATLRGWRDGFVVQALTGLPEDLGSITSTYMTVHNHSSSLRGFDTWFSPLQAPGTHIAHRQTYRQNTQIHEINNFNKLHQDTILPQSEQILVRMSRKRECLSIAGGNVKQWKSAWRFSSN